MKKEIEFWGGPDDGKTVSIENECVAYRVAKPSSVFWSPFDERLTEQLTCEIETWSIHKFVCYPYENSPSLVEIKWMAMCPRYKEGMQKLGYM